MGGAWHHKNNFDGLYERWFSMKQSEKDLWQAVRDYFFDRYNPTEEIDKVRLAWYAEGIFEDILAWIKETDSSFKKVREK